MSREKAKTETFEQDVDGHAVRIVRAGEHQELWIDGTRRRFFTNSGGFVLADNAYVPAKPSLLEAAEAYIRQLGPDAAGKPEPR